MELVKQEKLEALEAMEGQRSAGLRGGFGGEGVFDYLCGDEISFG